MSPNKSIRLFLAAICASAASSGVVAQSSTSTTTTPTTSEPSTQAVTSSQSATSTTVRSTDVTQPVPGPVIPPVGTPPRAVPGPVIPLNNAPTDDTRPLTPNAAQQAADAQRIPPAVDASTTLDASGNPIDVSGASIDALAAAGVDAALNLQNTVEALRTAPRAQQRNVLSQMRVRIAATGRAIAEVRAQARALGTISADTNFDQAAAEIRLREDVLLETLRNLDTADSDETWRVMRNQLVSQYQAYAEAVRRAQQLLMPPQN